MERAPVALFTYKRLQHTRLTVEALQKNDLAAETALIVFSDAARGGADRDAVEAVRAYLRGIAGFKSVRVVERKENFGLARSIISGVTEIVQERGKVIVVEDDLVTSSYFLRYMNDGLDTYADDDRVISIHGYVYPVSAKLPETFFLRGADCWGWATWRRGGEIFEADGGRLMEELRLRRLESAFDFHGTYPYTRMLEEQIAGRNDSWAIRWYASAFLRDRLTLYPGRSLVTNIGTDDSGTHCGATQAFDTEVAGSPVAVERIPVEESLSGRRAVEEYFRTLNPGVFRRVKNRLRRMLG